MTPGRSIGRKSKHRDGSSILMDYDDDERIQTKYFRLTSGILVIQSPADC